MSKYFPKPYEPFGGDINVKVDLSNYATKTDKKKYFTCLWFKFRTKIKLSWSKNWSRCVTYW